MTQKAKNSDQNLTLIIAIIVAVAIVGAFGFIFLSSQNSLTSSNINYSEIPQGRQDDGGFVLGDPNAPVTIVAFEDFLCPHCQAYKSTVNQFIEQYVVTGQARFEYRMLPAVDPSGSPLSARLVECSDILREGTFWEAHDVMFELASATRFNDRTPRQFADRMDLNYSDVLDCVTEADQVSIDTQLATQLGASGTPSVFVRIGDNTPVQWNNVAQPSLEQLGFIVQSAQASG